MNAKFIYLQNLLKVLTLPNETVIAACREELHFEEFQLEYPLMLVILEFVHVPLVLVMRKGIVSLLFEYLQLGFFLKRIKEFKF